MRLTLTDKFSSLNRIFTPEQIADSVLDETELKAVGLDDAMLTDLGLGAKAPVTESQAQRLMGAVLLRQSGQRIAGTRDERRLDADITSAYAAYSRHTGENLTELLTPLLTLPLDRKRKVLTLLSSVFGDDYYRSLWLRDPAQAKQVGLFVAALTKLPSFNASAMAFFVSVPKDANTAIELYQSLSSRLGGNTERLYAAGHTVSLLADQGVTEPKAQRDAILFLDRFVSRDASDIKRLHELHVPLASLSEANLSTEIAKVIGGLSPRIAADLINGMHDLQGANGGGDSHRLGIIAAMTQKDLVTILSSGGPSVYTSTYLAMLARIRSENPDVGAWIRAQGLTPDQLSGLCWTFSRFRQTDVVVQGGDLFAETILAGLKDQGWFANPSRFVALALAIYRQGSPEAKAKLETLLVEQYSKREGNIAPAAMVLRTAFDEGLTTSSMAATLPARPKIVAPVNEWLADGALTAVLFCYTEDHGSDPAGIAKFYMNAGFTEVAGKTPFGLSRRATRVFERTVAGVVQRIVITTDAERDRDEVIRLKGVDIVVHRGHSYQIPNTFPETVTSDPNGSKKLLFGGSCGSFGSMTSSSFQSAYGEHLILSDADTGQSHVNNPTLLKIMDGIVARKKTFDAYGLDTAVERDGIVLPDAAEQQLVAYSRLVSHAP